MRAIAICFVFAAVLTAGCLRGTAFRCAESSDCGAGGVCEPVGFCSVPNAECPGTGRSYGDSAGQGLSNTCVPAGSPGPGPGVDAGVDAPGDAMPVTRCPSDYAPVAGSAHLYKALSDVNWDAARMMCKQTSAAAYLAIPDDATELANLATVATAPFWIGIDDQGNQGDFVTQKGVPAMFLPWASGEPNMTGQNDCVDAISATEIATEKCSNKHAAVCECEP
jgi:hypothetical protein